MKSALPSGRRIIKWVSPVFQLKSSSPGFAVAEPDPANGQIHFAYMFSDCQADERIGLAPVLAALGEHISATPCTRPVPRAIRWIGRLLATTIAQPQMRQAPTEDGNPVLLTHGDDLAPLQRREIMANLCNAAIRRPDMGGDFWDIRLLALSELLPKLADPTIVQMIERNGPTLYARMFARTTGRQAATIGIGPVPVEFAFALSRMAWTGVDDRERASDTLRLGYRLSLTTAQSAMTQIAQCDGKPLRSLAPEQIAEGPARELIQRAGLDRRTPLWFYLLRESELFMDGVRLGPLGSRLLAETLYGLFSTPSDHAALPRRRQTPELWQLSGYPNPSDVWHR